MCEQRAGPRKTERWYAAPGLYRRTARLVPPAAAGVLLAAPALASAGKPTGLHSDPIAPVILSVTALLFFALLGRFAARNLGQPSVLGELVVGIIIGNVAYYFGSDLIAVLREGTAVFAVVEQALRGHDWREAAGLVLEPGAAERITRIMTGPDGQEILQIAQTVDVFSRYGVIFLLFLVGLESSLDEMRRAGGDSLRVALIGLICPLILGYLTTLYLMPDLSSDTDLFIAATLGATSVGITASVLKELGKLHAPESRIVLGAAVFDDILGLVMLAVVTGIVVSGGVQTTEVLSVIALSGIFLIGVFFLSPYFLNITIYLVRRMDVSEAKLFTSFLFVMALAWLANVVGLATIVGAFAAGLILHEAYFKHWGDPAQHPLSVKDLVAPVEAILVPIFFVLMGIQVQLESFMDLNVIILAAGLLLAAVAGKVVSGLGIRRGASRIVVGVGMMPRGEVGLVFASIGKSLDVINDALFSAIVLMVIVTTLATPPILKPLIARNIDR